MFDTSLVGVLLMVLRGGGGGGDGGGGGGGGECILDRPGKGGDGLHDGVDRQWMGW